VLCRVDAERQTPVAGDAEAPCTLAVAGQRVCLPRRERMQFVGVFHVIEEGQHFAEFVHRIGRHALYDVVLVELLQPLMREVPYSHRITVACSLTLVNPDRRMHHPFAGLAKGWERTPSTFARTGLR